MSKNPTRHTFGGYFTFSWHSHHNSKPMQPAIPVTAVGENIPPDITNPCIII